MYQEKYTIKDISHIIKILAFVGGEISVYSDYLKWANAAMAAILQASIKFPSWFSTCTSTLTSHTYNIQLHYCWYDVWFSNFLPYKFKRETSVSLTRLAIFETTL